MRARYPRFSATCKALLLASAITLCLTQPSHAALTVSSAATKHVTCSGGVCSATAAKATLNVTDLQNMLAAGDVSLVSGNVAGDIVVSRARNLDKHEHADAGCLSLHHGRAAGLR